MTHWLLSMPLIPIVNIDFLDTMPQTTFLGPFYSVPTGKNLCPKPSFRHPKKYHLGILQYFSRARFGSY